MDQLLTGVKKQYQSTGAAVVLMAELQDVMLKKGMKYIETTGIFETNHSAIGNWKNYDHIQHKRRRCYRKMFNT
jgi:limonene-1,2-epoxide hydrolase